MAVLRLFSGCDERELLPSCGEQASPCSGFFRCGAQALGHTGFGRCGARAYAPHSTWDLPGPGIEAVCIPYYWTTRKILSSVLHNKVLCFIVFFPMGLESCWNPAESCSILPHCKWEICIEHNDGPKTRCYCPCLGTGFCPVDFCAGPPLASAWSYGNSSA